MKVIELIKGWGTYFASLLVGSVGFFDKCKQFLDIAFVLLGCIGLILSIRLTLKKLRKEK